MLKALMEYLKMDKCNRALAGGQVELLLMVSQEWLCRGITQVFIKIMFLAVMSIK